MTPSDFVELEPEDGGRYDEPRGGVGGVGGGVRVRFDEARASAFAKGVAGDFNPLHDPGDRRFCVPGDLLFALLLEHYGLHRETSVGFASMVDASATLALPPLSRRADRGRGDGGARGDGGDAGGAAHVLDGRDREVLGFFAAGGRIAGGRDAFTLALILEYVRFSGATFPDILVPLMRERSVMVNPERPLIIYKDMAIRVDAGASLDDGAVPVLRHGAHELAVNGRKGVASLRFAILDARDGRRLGEGEKNFVLGGLREHDADTVEALVAEYDARRAAWRDGAARATAAAAIAGGAA